MAAPFRITKPAPTGTRGRDETFREYLERLLKMIPGEVLGLYMIGSGFIPEKQVVGLVVWSGICLASVVVIRIYGTADPQNGLPSQKVPVFVSAIAFLIWLYWLGGPFGKLGIQIPWVGSLAVLLWSFVIPIFYKG